MRAAFEEGKILWRREPIERVLDQPSWSPDERDKFKLVLAVREYARDDLRLNVGGSYASYSYVDRAVLSYVLTAAPKTDLAPYTWWFLVVGSVPYKGFFSEEAAEAEAEKFHAEGYDTYIRTAPAFSTLGWFDDPLLAHLLKYDKETLAEVIFHELFHNTLFASGAVDFNESLANFVGHRAAILFFRDRGGEGSLEHRRAVQSWEEELEFSEFIKVLANSLRDLYIQELPEEKKLQRRGEIFANAQEKWAERIANRPGHRFRGFTKEKINNAVIAHYLLYLRDLDLFESLYQAKMKDLPGMIALVKDSVQDGGDPFESVRGLVEESRS
jgi:predicted aminopeptidase